MKQLQKFRLMASLYFFTHGLSAACRNAERHKWTDDFSTRLLGINKELIEEIQCDVDWLENELVRFWETDDEHIEEYVSQYNEICTQAKLSPEEVEYLEGTAFTIWTGLARRYVVVMRALNHPTKNTAKRAMMLGATEHLFGAGFEDDEEERYLAMLESLLNYTEGEK